MKQTTVNRRALIIIALIALILILFSYKQAEFSDTRYEFKSDLIEPSRSNESIYLLFWNGYLESYGTWGMAKDTSSREDLEKINCSRTNCIFTSRKNLLPSVNDFDVLFVNPHYHVKLPETRSPHQYYVLGTIEAPDRAYMQLSQYSNNVFNLSMTHRLDSEIPWSYGEVIDLDINKPIAPALEVNWKKPRDNFTDENILKIYQGKQKTAAWFVSNCKTQISRRNELTKALQDQDIDVDIYGACGKLKTPNGNINEFLEKNYKFYFSFENSLCADYVTEKLYKVMNNYIIPVVFNGADMSRFAPPKSYVDANEFKTVEALAKYLNFLSNDPDEYVKYFWWKNDYKVNLTPVLEFPSDHWCRVCQKINELREEKIHKVYSNIKKWSENGICIKSKVKFD